MAAERTFQNVDHDHLDLVLAIDYNLYGTRVATASSDHNIKVWDKKDDNWVLIDTWRAHDAEVVDVRWNGPLIGEILGSIGEDGKFKVWQEDVEEKPNAGNRFKLIYSLVSPTKVPFMSLDIKHVQNDCCVALATRDGYLMVCEPVEQEDLTDWQFLFANYVRATPPRQEEASFRVAFHKETAPSFSATDAGLDSKALALAVAAMDTVKVYRTDKERQLYLAAELTGARDIIRDVAWSNGAPRGYDMIAAASKDGTTRVYELTIAQQPRPGDSHDMGGENGPSSPRARGARQQTSALGAELAVASRLNQAGPDDDSRPGRVKQQVKLVAELTHHHGAIWQVSFSHTGDHLITSGDDGTIHTWKQDKDRKWSEFSEMDPTRSR